MREGLASLDAELIEMGRSFGRSRLRNFLKIVVPALYPFIFATLRISFGVSWKVALTAELFGGNAGLGYLFNVARQEYNTPLIFAVIGLIIAFVYSVNRFVFVPLQAPCRTHLRKRLRRSRAPLPRGAGSSGRWPTASPSPPCWRGGRCRRACRPSCCPTHGPWRRRRRCCSSTQPSSYTP